MAAADPLLCGIDVGTGSVRAIVFALDGTVVAIGARPTPIVTLGPGAAEFDPDALWQAVAAAIADATAQLDDPRRVRAVAVASFGESGAALDSDGRPVAVSHAWYDTRPDPLVDALAETYGEDHLVLTNGMRLDQSPSLGKILWLREHHPDAFSRAVRWLNTADFIAWHLSGEMATDPSLAGRTLVFDLGTDNWNDSLLADLDLPTGLFAPVAPNGHPLGPVTADAATATGLAEDCLVATGGHDHVIAALASGGMNRNWALDSVGTAEPYLRAIDGRITDRRIVDWGFDQGLLRVGRALRFCYGGLVTASASVEWFRRVYAGDADYDALIAAAAAAPPGAQGALFLPHLRLGSPPDVSAGATGAFLGLTTETDPGCLFRAVLEGIALDMRHIADHSETLAATIGMPPAERIRMTGGGIRNTLLVDIKAAAYGKPVDAVTMPESTSLGAALLAGIAAGLYADIDAALASADQGARTVTPDPALLACYDAILRDRYVPALAALKSLRGVSRPAG